jgi:lysozyme
MDIDALKKQLVLHEGMKLTPYRCTADKLTIGVGRNLDDMGITEKEAEFMLDTDILRCCDDLDRNISWWRDLSETRQRVLVDMVFNLGISRFMKFQNMIDALANGNYAGAAAEMLDSRWADQVGQRAQRLSRAMENDELDI